MNPDLLEQLRKRFFPADATKQAPVGTSVNTNPLAWLGDFVPKGSSGRRVLDERIANLSAPAPKWNDPAAFASMQSAVEGSISPMSEGEGAVAKWAAENGPQKSAFLQKLEARFPNMQKLQQAPVPSDPISLANQEKWFNNGDLAIGGRPALVGHSSVNEKVQFPKTAPERDIKYLKMPPLELGAHFGPPAVGEQLADWNAIGRAEDPGNFLAARSMRGYNEPPVVPSRGVDNINEYKTHGQLVDAMSNGQFTLPLVSNIKNPVELTDNKMWRWDLVLDDLKKRSGQHNVDVEDLVHRLQEVAPNAPVAHPHIGTSAINKDRMSVLRDELEKAGHHGAWYKNAIEIPPTEELINARGDFYAGKMGLREYDAIRDKYRQPSFIDWRQPAFKSAIANSGAFSPKSPYLSKAVIGTAGMGGLAGLKQMMGGSQEPKEFAREP